MPQSAFKVKRKARPGVRWAVPERGISTGAFSRRPENSVPWPHPCAKPLITQSPGLVPVANVSLNRLGTPARSLANMMLNITATCLGLGWKLPLHYTAFSALKGREYVSPRHAPQRPALSLPSAGETFTTVQFV